MTPPRGLHAICALPGEAATLARRGIEVSVCGVGPVAARRAAEQALAGGARTLLSWGVAGALAPRLSTGDVFVPSRVADAEGRVWSTGRGAGSLLSVAAPVTRAEDKRALWRTTGCEAADMEGAAIAAVCAAHGASFLSVRAIADPALHSLPPWLPDLVGSNGRTRWRALPRVLRRERGAAAALLRCAKEYRAALRALRLASSGIAELAGATP